MKRSEYAGWREVFAFSLKQGLKQKSFRGFLLVMCLVILAAMPISTWLQQREQESAEATGISSFTIYDETGLGIDYSGALAGERYEGMQIAAAPAETFESHVQALEDSQGSTEMIVHITYEETGYFSLTFVKAASAQLKEEDCDLLVQDFEEYFQAARTRAVEVSQEQLAFMNQPVEIQVRYTTQEGEITAQEKGEGISMTEYYVLLAGITVVMMFVNMSGSRIAFSVVTEKSTRVVEYLMIHVRPMALIVGKILAALITVLIQFAAYGICYLLSGKISRLLFGVQGAADPEQVSAAAQLLSGVHAGNLIIAGAMILMGVLFYGIVAGLAGASVSKMEEMAEGLKLYQLSIVIGTYVGIFLCIMQMLGNVSAAAVNICCILPLSAPFTVPVNLLLGRVGMGTALIALVVMALCTAVLFSFTARVYESMIFYNGNVLKLKDILQLAKNRRTAAAVMDDGIQGTGKEKHHE